MNELNIRIAEVREKIAEKRNSGEKCDFLEKELRELETQRRIIDSL